MSAPWRSNAVPREGPRRDSTARLSFRAPAAAMGTAITTSSQRHSVFANMILSPSQRHRVSCVIPGTGVRMRRFFSPLSAVFK